jgi:hypothetical protein
VTTMTAAQWEQCSSSIAMSYSRSLGVFHPLFFLVGFGALVVV